MKKNTLFLSLLILLITGCNNQKETTIYSLAEESKLLISPAKEVSLSQLFSPDYVLIPLESGEESMIGRINKIVKQNGHYYILSNDRWIFRFDENGTYMGKLSKMGGSPEEYERIGDFSVYTIQGRTEIWLCDHNRIKIYNADSFEFLRSITTDPIIHKFYRLEDGDLLLMTGLENHSLTLTDPEGTIKDQYLEKEIAYLTFRSVQFTPYDSKLLFQLGTGNEFVWFDRDKKEFGKGVYSKKDNLLDTKTLLELFDKHHEEYIFKFRDYNYIQHIRQIRDKTFFDIHANGQRYLSVLDKFGNVISSYYRNETNIKNDLFELEEMDFLSSLGCGLSDDNSLILVIEEEEMIRKLSRSNKRKIDTDVNDENPWLVVFSCDN